MNEMRIGIQNSLMREKRRYVNNLTMEVEKRKRKIASKKAKVTPSKHVQLSSKVFLGYLKKVIQ
jgi:hypothetical protein